MKLTKTKPTLSIAKYIGWILQGTIFIIGGLYWLFFPETALRNLLTPNLHKLIDLNAEYAENYVQFLSPYALFFGIATYLAVLRSSALLQRDFARVFSIFLTLWLLVVLYNFEFTWIDNQKVLQQKIWGLLCLGIALVTFNIFLGFKKNPAALSELATGYVKTKPDIVWRLWLFQAVVFCSLGIVQILFAEQMLIFVGAKPDGITTKHLEMLLAFNQVRIVGPYSIGFGLLCAYATTIKEWHVWRGFTSMCVCFFGTNLFLYILRFEGATYTPGLYFFSCIPTFIFLVGNLTILMCISKASRHLPKEQIERDWLVSDLFPGLTMGLQSFLTRRRASHLLGVAAKGTATVRANFKSKNDFFNPKSELHVTARFANLTMQDDAAMDVRGAAICIEKNNSENTPKETLTLMMNTGAICPARNIIEFTSFVVSKWLPKSIKRRAILANSRTREGGIVGLRRAPSSYTNLCYYSQMIRLWDFSEGTYLVRFRLVPKNHRQTSTSTESDILFNDKLRGIPTIEDRLAIWNRERLHTEKRPKNYLREEFRTKIAHCPKDAQLLLQAQFRPAGLANIYPDWWFDASVEWPTDGEANKWHNLAEIHLNHVLSDTQTEELTFDPSKLPTFIRIPQSDSWWDCRSMAAAEARVVPVLQRFRHTISNWFGVPDAK